MEGSWLTYIMKRRGPSIEPCGTPVVMGALEEVVPFMKTDCFLFERYEVNHFSAVLVMFREASLSIIK